MRSRPAISLAVSASLALGSGAAAPTAWAADSPAAPEASGGVSIKVGQAEAFSRIEFDQVQPRSARREGQDLVLQFGHVSPPNLSLLRVDPPRYLKTASTQTTPEGTELRLTLAEGVEAKVGHADGGAYVNLSPSAGSVAPADQVPGRKVDPIPASGVVKVHAGLQQGTLSLRFDWRAPVGAAVFRRGEAIWVVFDAHARLDLGEAPGGLPQARRIEVVAAPNVTALRILAPPTVQASASAQDASWTVALSAIPGAPSSPVAVKPEAGGLSVQMAGATGVFWLDDPAVGDRLAVVTALGPPKGALALRRLVDVDILASVQGLALSPLAQDLTVASDTDVVRIGRPSGLQLSADAALPILAATPLGLPQPTALPALVDFDGWSRTGRDGFLARYEALLQGASDEGGAGQGRPAASASRLRPLPGRLAAGVRGHRRAGPDGQDQPPGARHARVPGPARRRPRDGWALQGRAGRLLLAGGLQRPIERALARLCSGEARRRGRRAPGASPQGGGCWIRSSPSGASASCRRKGRRRSRAGT